MKTFPSIVSLLLLALLMGLPLRGQNLTPDTRLSPDEGNRRVAEGHRVAHAIELDGRTMVLFGTTVIDGGGQLQFGLAIGLLEGRTWIRTPTLMAGHADRPTTNFRVVALDSIFVVLWEGIPDGGPTGLYVHPFDRDGQSLADPLRIGSGLLGTYALRSMPGLLTVFLRNEGPITLTFDTELRVRTLNPDISPSTSFQLGADTSLMLVRDDTLYHYSSIYDTIPLQTMPTPIVDIGAIGRAASVVSHGDSGFTLGVLSVTQSPGYHTTATGAVTKVVGWRFRYEDFNAVPAIDSIFEWTSVFGSAVPGFGTYHSYRSSKSFRGCDLSSVGVVQLNSQHLRAGNPSDVPYITTVGFTIDRDLPLAEAPYALHRQETLACTPSGLIRRTVYGTTNEQTTLTIDTGENEVTIDASFGKSERASSKPMVIKDTTGVYITWGSPGDPMILRRVNQLRADSIEAIDSLYFMELKEPSNSRGCDNLRSSSALNIFLQDFYLRESRARYCSVALFDVRISYYSRSQITGVRDGEFTIVHLEESGPTTDAAEYFTTKVVVPIAEETDDRSLLLHYTEQTKGGEVLGQWIGGSVDARGKSLWKSTGKRHNPAHALPAGGTEWLAFDEDRVSLMDRDDTIDTFDLPPLASSAQPTFQALPGDWFLRRQNFVENGTIVMELQIANFRTHEVFTRTLPQLGAMPPYLLTHPEDSSRIIVWATSTGVFGMRLSRDLDTLLMAPTRLSETAERTTAPAALFMNDTLLIVWEDFRHTLPSIYGRQIRMEKVEIKENTNAIQEGVSDFPDKLDLSESTPVSTKDPDVGASDLTSLRHNPARLPRCSKTRASQ